MGVDVSILHWRGLFGPPGIPADTVKYWDSTLGKMVKTEHWKQALEKHGWFDAYADSATFRKALDEEAKVNAQILSELGMAKGAAKK
jgi:putative tricarboxylic transport membrane protein